MKKTTFLISLCLNLLLLLYIAFLHLVKIFNGSAAISDGKIGILSRDLAVGVFDTDHSLFKLPKGLMVRDASATGAGWFEPHRFQLIITSDRDDLVDYSSKRSSTANINAEFYSADVKNRK